VDVLRPSGCLCPLLKSHRDTRCAEVPLLGTGLCRQPAALSAARSSAAELRHSKSSFFFRQGAFLPAVGFACSRGASGRFSSAVLQMLNAFSKESWQPDEFHMSPSGGDFSKKCVKI